jgi:hypothetical protein
MGWLISKWLDRIYYYLKFLVNSIATRPGICISNQIFRAYCTRPVTIWPKYNHPSLTPNTPLNSHSHTRAPSCWCVCHVPYQGCLFPNLVNFWFYLLTFSLNTFFVCKVFIYLQIFMPSSTLPQHLYTSPWLQHDISLQYVSAVLDYNPWCEGSPNIEVTAWNNECMCMSLS